ncbi:MAG: hypothetical protein ACJA1A_003593 [Saprospiraceae bacterium]
MSQEYDIDDIFENNDDPVSSNLDFEDPQEINQTFSEFESELSEKLKNLHGFSNAIHVTAYDSLSYIYKEFLSSHNSQANIIFISTYRHQQNPILSIDDYVSVVSAESLLTAAHFYSDAMTDLVNKMSELNFFDEQDSFKGYIYRKYASELNISSTYLEMCQNSYRNLSAKFSYDIDENLYDTGVSTHASTMDRIAHNKIYSHSFQNIGVINSVIESRNEYIQSLSAALCYIAEKIDSVIKSDPDNISGFSIERINK